MRINKDADLAILLDYGWESFRGGEQGCYYKEFDSIDNAVMSLIINPIGVEYSFVINSYYEENGRDYDDSCVDMFRILEEIEVLKKLDRLNGRVTIAAIPREESEE